jgi:hypothetical protein
MAGWVDGWMAVDLSGLSEDGLKCCQSEHLPWDLGKAKWKDRKCAPSWDDDKDPIVEGGDT